MGQPDMVIIPEQRAEMERQLQRTDLRRRERERLEMVKAAALGDEVERIARWSGHSVETVTYRLARFTVGGVAALANAQRSGQRGRLGDNLMRKRARVPCPVWRQTLP
jgi:hypothetical protein